MEDVSQSLQEAHERCHQLSEDIGELRDMNQSKMDAKVDITTWNEMNDDIDASIKTVRDMVSGLRLEVDSRRRKVDEEFTQIRGNAKALETKVGQNGDSFQKQLQATNQSTDRRCEELKEGQQRLEAVVSKHAETHNEIQNKIDQKISETEALMRKQAADSAKQDEDLHKEATDRVDSLERYQATVAQAANKRLNALDLRMSGLQGSSGELKRDASKLRDEVNNLMVKTAAHDVDIGKNSDDIRKFERQRAEDGQRHKQNPKTDGHDRGPNTHLGFLIQFHEYVF